MHKELVMNKNSTMNFQFLDEWGRYPIFTEPLPLTGPEVEYVMTNTKYQHNQHTKNISLFPFFMRDKDSSGTLEIYGGIRKGSLGFPAGYFPDPLGSLAQRSRTSDSTARDKSGELIAAFFKFNWIFCVCRKSHKIAILC